MRFGFAKVIGCFCALTFILDVHAVSHWTISANLKCTSELINTYPISIPLDGPIAPLQFELGFAEVREKVAKWIEDANLLIQKDGSSFPDAVLITISKYSSQRVEALFSPDGRIRPTDGHHKISAAMEILRLCGLPQNAVEWRFKVPRRNDFRGRTWKEFAAAIKKRGWGDYSEAEIIRLPSDFGGMVDSPIRSACGRFFETMKLKGSFFYPMIQISLGRALSKYGLRVVAGQEFEDFTQGQIYSLLFNSPHSKELKSLLMAHVLPEYRSKVKKILRAH